MNERQTVRVKLHPESYDAEVNTALPDAIEWLNELLESVPPEYRDQTAFVVELERGHYDESDSLTFDIYYDRPETDGELATRLAESAAYAAARQREQESRERAEFERLNAKFGPRS